MGFEYSRPARIYAEDVLYSPSDTLRRCRGGHRCDCRLSHHLNPKLYFVEHYNDGTQKCRDPADYIERLVRGDDPRPMPWKNPKDWTTRDFEYLAEIIREYNNRARGMGARATPRLGPQGAVPSWRSSRNRGDLFAKPELPQDKVEQILRNHQDWLQNINDLLFGSEAEQRERNYRSKQARVWKEMFQHRRRQHAARGHDLQTPDHEFGQGIEPARYPPRAQRHNYIPADEIGMAHEYDQRFDDYAARRGRGHDLRRGMDDGGYAYR